MPTPTDRNNKDGSKPPANRPTTAPNKPPAGARNKPAREERLAEALRDNLRRRKAGGKSENKDA